MQSFLCRQYSRATFRPGVVLHMVMLALVAGCTAWPERVESEDVLFIVHGAGGAGSTYNGLINALSGGDQAPPRAISLFRWGAPSFLFALNFSDRRIHEKAESALAREMVAWRAAHPEGRIMLVGHSAGGGVVLGALARLKEVRVDRVILLHPSVSPGYDISPALDRVDGALHAFTSDRDTLFLSWRCRNFGTYDRVNTAAAGHRGFDKQTSVERSNKLVEHPYQPTWDKLDHAGGHFGALSRDFVREVIAPLLR